MLRCEAEGRASKHAPAVGPAPAGLRPSRLPPDQVRGSHLRMRGLVSGPDQYLGEKTRMTSPRWKRRPHGSTWGDFGPDDERGRLNLLTPEKVRQGVAEVRDRKSTRLNSSHTVISYAVFCLKKKKNYPATLYHHIQINKFTIYNK